MTIIKSKNLSLKVRFISLAVLLVVIPCVALAAPTDFKSLVGILTTIIAQVIPVVAGLALLYFFWGTAKYIFAQGNEESKLEGKSIMIWGLVGLFFLFSVYGIVSFFGSVLPKFPGAGTAPIKAPEKIDPYSALPQE